jgi:hypothetical protein
LNHAGAVINWAAVCAYGGNFEILSGTMVGDGKDRKSKWRHRQSRQWNVECERAFSDVGGATTLSGTSLIVDQQRVEILAEERTIQALRTRNFCMTGEQ